MTAADSSVVVEAFYLLACYQLVMAVQKREARLRAGDPAIHVFASA